MGCQDYIFYAVKTDYEDDSFFASSRDALEEIAEKLTEDDTVSYTIERVVGIWELVQRIGAMENYQNEWMLTALTMVHELIEELEELENL